jgi:hypothetical protein
MHDTTRHDRKRGSGFEKLCTVVGSGVRLHQSTRHSLVQQLDMSKLLHRPQG